MYKPYITLRIETGYELITFGAETMVITNCTDRLIVIIPTERGRMRGNQKNTIIQS